MHSSIGKFEIILKRKGKESLYTVERDGKILGLLTKYRDTKTVKHPWKAFNGYGMACTLLDCFYPSEGGKQAAIDAVLNANL